MRGLVIGGWVLVLGISGCGPQFQVTRGELDLTRYDAAPDARAVVLERSAKATLAYTKEIDDAALFKASGKIQGGAYRPPGTGDTGGAANSAKHDSSAAVIFQGASSYSLTVEQRLKLLKPEALDLARVAEPLPPGAELQSFEGATYLPDGQVLPIDPVTAKLESGRLVFECPGATPGSVLAWRYTIFSADLSGLGGWTFQGDLPVRRASFSLKLLAGTNLPFRFVKTADGQKTDPREERAIGMEGENWFALVWELADLPPVAEPAPRAALVFGD